MTNGACTEEYTMYCCDVLYFPSLLPDTALCFLITPSWHWFYNDTHLDTIRNEHRSNTKPTSTRSDTRANEVSQSHDVNDDKARTNRHMYATVCVPFAGS